MIRIFAHRAKINEDENTLEGIKFFVKNKIDVELDIRKNKELYLSHDKTGKGYLFNDACEILKHSKITAALHIKEINAISDTITMIKENKLEDKCFIFTTINNYELNQINEEIKIANYVTERKKMKGKILWCDESTEKWFDDSISKLHNQDCFLIAMSPELLGEKDMEIIKKEWKRLTLLKFDGICTNFPIKLKEWIKDEIK